MSAEITLIPVIQTIDERIMRLSSTDNPNAQLAAKILEQAKTDKLTLDSYTYSEEYRKNGRENILNDLVSIVDTEKFMQNPIHSIVDELISRAAKLQFNDYEDINILATHVPNFEEKICKIEGLKSIAAERYENHPKKDEILEIFNRSLEYGSFKKCFAQAASELPRPPKPFCIMARSSRKLIEMFHVFVMSENLMPYKESNPITLEPIPPEFIFKDCELRMWSDEDDE
jgi:hypothetical protein